MSKLLLFILLTLFTFPWFSEAEVIMVIHVDRRLQHIIFVLPLAPIPKNK